MVDQGSAATRAGISRGRLREAALAAVRSGREIADLRRDAYGHGIAGVADAIAQAGIRRARIDADIDGRMLRAIGIEPTTTAEPDIDPAELYGFGPGLTPAMRLTGSVLSVKHLRRGEAVSYGYTHRAAEDTRIALVTGGYAQGIVRALGNGAEVEIAGRLHPIVGRVAMDVCVVDLADAPVSRGDEAVYFGGTGPARTGLERWAARTGLTAAELACACGLRAARTEED